jgi:hypothetical protein
MQVMNIILTGGSSAEGMIHRNVDIPHAELDRTGQWKSLAEEGRIERKEQ